MSKSPSATSVYEAPPKATPGDPSPPAVVNHGLFVAAQRPILELVGFAPEGIWADGLSITSDRIEFVSVTPVDGVEPVQVGNDDEWGCWGWPVVVKVDLP